MQSAVSLRQSFREFEFPRARDSIPMIGRHRRWRIYARPGPKLCYRERGGGRLGRGGRDSFEFRRTHLRRPTSRSIPKSKTNMPEKEKCCSVRFFATDVVFVSE